MTASIDNSNGEDTDNQYHNQLNSGLKLQLRRMDNEKGLTITSSKGSMLSEKAFKYCLKNTSSA